MPGYPFYIAGLPGHRPPQAAHDIAVDLSKPDRPLLSGGLGRHVVERSGRKLGVTLPPDQAARESQLLSALEPGLGENRLQLEALRRQLVAKALALGDMTGHLENAVIRPLDPDGTPLERAGQSFHYNGSGLDMRAPDGSAATFANGSYATPLAPMPGVSTPDVTTTGAITGRYQVNGAPPAPGAPFSDPCGGAFGRDGTALTNDPFDPKAAPGALTYITDEKLTGFRRYEVSAVQVDLVVNQAGWHDPQARIDVLTSRSGEFKIAQDTTQNATRISPRVTDSEEPFFFRALSGECIEFRHTNELPKDLELDDFQVRTPTDTIGQHIHLVKFDVTSSDGSGNGWNYEDGTFAADELMARRCAALGSLVDDPAKGVTAANAAMCAAAADKADPLSRIWRLPLSGASALPGVPGMTPNRSLFQTTVQRWFADPVLTKDGLNRDQDRTLRTVFSHDHFGPSSIQQHGFYTALLIEPNSTTGKATVIADPRTGTAASVQPKDLSQPPLWRVQLADSAWVGSHKILRTPELGSDLHPDYREFALAVADFAVLYDPRDRETAASIEPQDSRAADTPDRAGMARLYCEARLAAQGRRDQIAALCGLPDPAEPLADASPAWWASGRPDGSAGQAIDNLFLAHEADELRSHLISWRSRAASPDLAPVAGAQLASPVAPPARPESISVDHHDPYVVNYRNAPVPLRLGTKNADGSPSPDCQPLSMSFAGAGPSAASQVVQTLILGQMPVCSYRYQLAGPAGDAGRAFSSWVPKGTGFPTRDPETPQFESYQDERLLFRLVQGAQEVQHVFNIAGMPATRNIDQRYPQGMRDLAVTTPPARVSCFARLRSQHPEDYEKWLNLSPYARATDYIPGNPDHAAFLSRSAEFDKTLADCDNAEGYTFAQEVGISEHFEMRARLRADVRSSESLVAVMQANTPQSAPSARKNGAESGHETISDYLYNFGTLDAFWNGAWGVVRIYRDPAARNAALPADARGPDGALRPERRLVRIPDASQAGESGSNLLPSDDRDDQFGALNTCPLAVPQNDATSSVPHSTAAVVVALRTADVWGAEIETNYGGDRRDPDGLMLALLPADKILDRTKTPLDFSDDPAWQKAKLSRDSIIEMVRDAYDRPEPFVLRVNAGDCVHLRYLNTLQEKSPGAGQADGLGDALAPRIAPLNLDPDARVVRQIDANGTRVQGTLVAQTAPITGLRPSAMLGLTIGLPGGDLIRNLPLGFGINGQAMAAPIRGSDQVVVSDMFSFYAGRVRLALPEQPATDPVLDLSQAVVKRVSAMLRQDFPAHVGAFTSHEAIPPEQPDFTVLGRRIKISGVVLNGAQQARMQLAAAIELQQHLRWIPYAYGPVPVRVTGDIISQPAHGLFGVVDVLPAQWKIPDTLALAMPVPKLAGEVDKALADLAAQMQPSQELGSARAWRSASLPKDFGAPALFAQSDLFPNAPEGTEPTHHRVREFVIFYQDGLNQLDAGSKIRWNITATGPKAVRDAAAQAQAREKPKLTPDCLICDDSYDLGDQGVSYRSRPFASLLRYADIAGDGRIEASDDLNAITFPPDFFAGKPGAAAQMQPLTLRACPGDQVVIRVVHPGGRARQHAFVMNGLGYDDLFPGFGFPNSALLAPGKAVSAWLNPPRVKGPDGTPQAVTGKVLWHDGPNFLTAGGIWGLVDFRDDTTLNCKVPE